MKFNKFALSELATIKYGKNQKKVLSEGGNIPIYGTGGLMGYATTALYDKPSVLIGRKGTIGKVKYVEHPFWTVDTLFYTIVNTDIVLPKYLYYVMSLMDLNNYNEGTTIPSLRTETLNRLEFDIPSLVEQETILSCLNPIDEKIALNNAINNNLEQQAQALVKEYCASTDFEVPLGSIMNFVNGFAFQSKAYQKSGKYRIVTIKNVQDGRIDTKGAAYIDDVPAKMKNECYLQMGDILLSLTGNVGRVGIVFENNLLLNQRVAKLTSSKDILPLLYFFFRLSETKASLETIAKGTAQQNLSPIETLKLSLPYDEDKALILSQTLKPIFDSIVNNSVESSKLAQLRDSLLPKLMSGELDVSNIEL